MTDWLINAWLWLKYKLLKNNQKEVDFGCPTLTEDFNNPTWEISERNQYAADMIILKDNVEVKDGKLLLHVKYENKEFSSWWGTARKTWSVGYVEFKNNIFPYGIWSVKCKLPDDEDAWPAIWLLRERHPEPETKIDFGNALKIEENVLSVPGWTDQRIDFNWYVWLDETIIGFVAGLDRINLQITVDRPIPETGDKRVFVSPDHIIPEVDIMEIIRGKIQHTIHYGYSNTVYKASEWNVKRGKPDLSKEYEFSVEIAKSGYKFYIDRVLTGVLMNKKAITNAGAYLILNNAKHGGITSGKNSVFEISEVKFYNKSL